MIQTKIPIVLQIEEMVKDVPGWTPLDQLHTLFTLVFSGAQLPGEIVEIGSWCGRSTVALGLAAKMTGVKGLHCVDLFPEKGDWIEGENGVRWFQVVVEGETLVAYKNQPVWKEPFERDIAPLYEHQNGIYDIFQQTMKKTELTDVVKAYRGNSAMFIKNVPRDFQCKLLFLDGDHSYSAVSSDIQNMEPFLVEHGWICFDDAFSHYEGVNRAITEHIIESGKYGPCQQMTRKLFVARKNSTTRK